MNRKYIMSAAAAMVLGVVACADMPTMSPDDALMKRGQGQGAAQGGETQQKYNGPTWVAGEFALTIANGGAAVAPGINAHPRGPDHGTCRTQTGTISLISTENTVWYNSEGKRTSAKFCQGSEGGTTTIVCSIDAIPATYAAAGNNPGSGNENLNFLTDEEGDVEGLFVHYKANSGTTVAKGSVPFTYTCNGNLQGDGWLNLEQWNGAGLFFVAGTEGTRSLVLEDKSIHVGDVSYPLTEINWIFRSRVGG